MEVYEIYIEIQRLLEELRTQHQEKISEYKKDINYLNNVCDEQSMELQRANNLLAEYEDEIRRLRGENI